MLSPPEYKIELFQRSRNVIESRCMFVLVRARAHPVMIIMILCTHEPQVNNARRRAMNLTQHRALPNPLEEESAAVSAIPFRLRQ